MKKGTTLPDDKMRAKYRKVRVNGKQMPLHRAIVEAHIGRELLPCEVVHHINGNKLDNRIENLQIMQLSDHCRMENLGRKHSDETRAKVSKSLIGNQRRTGIPHSQEIKDIIGQKSKEARAKKFWSSGRKTK